MLSLSILCYNFYQSPCSKHQISSFVDLYITPDPFKKTLHLPTFSAAVLGN